MKTDRRPINSSSPWAAKETTEERQLNVRIGNRLQRIARLLQKEFSKCGAKEDQVQFSLLVWGPGRMQYVSDAERSTVKEAMQEMVAKWDDDKQELGKPEMPLGGIKDD